MREQRTQATRRLSLAFCLLALGGGTACANPGLPPLNSAQDASQSGESEFKPAPNPFTSSAFDGVELDGGMDHSHHMGHKPKPKPKPKPDVAKAETTKAAKP